MPGLAVQEDQARGRDVEREPKERQDQQQRREGVELDGLQHVERDEQHQEAARDVQDQEDVQQRARQRDDEHPHDHHHDDREHEVALLEHSVEAGGRGLYRCTGCHDCILRARPFP
ncbi:hypothetical protein D3C86_1427300 [compost metagenome]